MKDKDKNIKVVLEKSLIGRNIKQRATARAFGLTRRGKVVVHKKTPQIMGMVRAISHIVKVEDIDDKE
ncbi:MAG: 50S ribosomal protein L30 [bacterium]